MPESATEAPVGYTFGPFFLDTQRLALFRDGRAAGLSPRALELLAYLVQADGRAVSKDQIIDAVWGGAAVSDGNVAQHVHMARETLGDQQRPYLYIKTVSTGGYRFSGQATPVFGSGDREAARELRQFSAAQLLSSAAYFSKMGTPPALDSSIELSKRAIGLAPSAEAYAQIALSHFLQGASFFRASEESLSLAELYAAEALHIDPQSASARAIMALVHLFWQHDPGRALNALDTGGGISNADPEIFWIVRMLALLAREDAPSAKAACNEALVATPASGAVNLYVGFVLYHAGCAVRAADHLNRMLAIKPYSGFATALLGFAYLVQEEYDRARVLFERLLMPTGQMLAASGKFLQWAIVGLSYIEGRAGNREISRALCRDLERLPNVSPTFLALSALSRQEYDVALMRLELARLSHDLQFPFVHCNPLFDPIKTSPEFLALLSRAAA